MSILNIPLLHRRSKRHPLIIPLPPDMVLYLTLNLTHINVYLTLKATIITSADDILNVFVSSLLKRGLC